MNMNITITNWADYEDDEEEEEKNHTINDIEQLIKLQVDSLLTMSKHPPINDDYEADIDDITEEVKNVAIGKRDSKRPSYKKSYGKKKTQARRSQSASIYDYEISSKQRGNNIYIDNTEDYVHYLEQNIRPCKFGINCFREHCNFMHVLPEAECEKTYTGEICGNVMTCGKIHQKRCKYDMNCNKKDCSFKHSTDMPNTEAQNEYIKNMDRYLSL